MEIHIVWNADAPKRHIEDKYLNYELEINGVVEAANGYIFSSAADARKARKIAREIVNAIANTQ